jgi:Histidine phosphatase superfamily (branch 1)
MLGPSLNYCIEKMGAYCDRLISKSLASAALQSNVTPRPPILWPSGGQRNGKQGSRCILKRHTTVLLAASSAATQETGFEELQFRWTGTDEFTPLMDRKDAPPLPLPVISSPQRVVLVRHGQSTWNAEGRIQGSSNFAILTPKGEAQAETARQMVRPLSHP